MTPYRIKRHRQRRHGASHFALIPFIDMMTILVVFLLAHTAEVDILPNTKNISIPQSLSDRKPSAAVVVMVTKDSVYVDGKLVGLGGGCRRQSGAGVRAAQGRLDGAERAHARAAPSKPTSPSAKSRSWATRTSLQRAEENHADMQRRRVRQGVLRRGRARAGGDLSMTAAQIPPSAPPVPASRRITGAMNCRGRRPRRWSGAFARFCAISSSCSRSSRCSCPFCRGTSAS